MKKIFILFVFLFFIISLYSNLELQEFIPKKEYVIYIPENDGYGNKIEENRFSRVKFDLITKFGNIQIIKGNKKNYLSILRYNYENKSYKFSKYRVFIVYGTDDNYMKKLKNRLIKLFNNYNVIIIKRDISIL